MICGVCRKEDYLKYRESTLLRRWTAEDKAERERMRAWTEMADKINYGLIAKYR